MFNVTLTRYTCPFNGSVETILSIDWPSFKTGFMSALNWRTMGFVLPEALSGEMELRSSTI
jgi:hypothetical protein